LDLKAKLVGKENPDYAQSVSNLSMLYQLIGKYDKAEALSRESKDLGTNPGKGILDAYLASTMNLANIYVATRRYKEAQCYFQRHCLMKKP